MDRRSHPGQPPSSLDLFVALACKAQDRVTAAALRAAKAATEDERRRALHQLQIAQEELEWI